VFTRSFVAALALLAGAAPEAQAQHLPWKHGDKPPTLAGFTLYEKPAAARARLGADVTVDTLGSGPDAALSFTSRKRGISFVASKADGVAIIYVTSRDAGMLDSVRVGDSRQRVLARWGEPSAVQGSNAVWMVDEWVIVVQLGEGNEIVRLGLGRQG
jgi:hypothetical protein